jgi:hypothetical protein
MKRKLASSARAASLEGEKAISSAVHLKSLGDYNGSRELLRGLGRHSLDIVSTVARYELALLHAQLGEDEEAENLLVELGFRYRLSPSVLCPRLNSLQASPSSMGMITNHPSYAVAYDGIIPKTLLSALQTAFDPSSSFWIEHGYPTSEFFSYNIRASDDNTLIGQLAKYLSPVVKATFPEKFASVAVESVEWWAHVRDESSGYAHQMHFDLDEQSLRDGGSVRNNQNSLHPLVSSVLYLSDYGADSTAPTFVTNQTLDEGSVATEGIFCLPKENRLLLFAGELLHGVVPYLPLKAKEGVSCHRITLMLGFWGKHFESKPSPPTLIPNMQMPILSSSKTVSLTWPRLFSPLDCLLVPTPSVHMSPCLSALVRVAGPIWIPLNKAPPLTAPSDAESAVEFTTSLMLEMLRKQQPIGGKRRKQKRKGDEQSSVEEVVFLGKWFLKSATEIRDDVIV